MKATGEEGDGKAIRCGREVWTSAHRKAETLARRECVRLREFELRGESYFSSPMRMSSSCRSERSSSFSLIYSTCLTVSGRGGEHGNSMAAPPRKTRSSCIWRCIVSPPVASTCCGGLLLFDTEPTLISASTPRLLEFPARETDQ